MGSHVALRAVRQRRIEDAVGDIAVGGGTAGEAFFQSIALRLAQHGSHIILNYRSSAAAARRYRRAPGTCTSSPSRAGTAA